MNTEVNERQVREALKASSSVTLAAASLGISRATMYRLMKRYSVEIRRIVA